MWGDRGQIQTIEGLTAAIIIVIVLVTVVQTSSVTPLSSSFTNQHIKLELKNVGNDILSSLDETRIYNSSDPSVPSLLKQSIVIWVNYDNCTQFSWNNTTYVSTHQNNITAKDTGLYSALKFALIKKGTAFNVELRYPNEDGYMQTTKMVWNGDPSENSVMVSRYIVLRDDDISNNRIIPDISTTDLHNTIEVRLTMWVM